MDAESLVFLRIKEHKLPVMSDRMWPGQNLNFMKTFQFFSLPSFYEAKT